MRFIIIAAAFIALLQGSVTAESVDVKYRGAVDLLPFACTDTPRSSFIRRVCYDDKNRYMIIQLNNAYYHYCELPKTTFAEFTVAPSMGQYFNQNIKGTGSDGPFDCRTHRVPNY